MSHEGAVEVGGVFGLGCGRGVDMQGLKNWSLEKARTQFLKSSAPMKASIMLLSCWAEVVREGNNRGGGHWVAKMGCGRRDAPRIGGWVEEEKVGCGSWGGGLVEKRVGVFLLRKIIFHFYNYK